MSPERAILGVAIALGLGGSARADDTRTQLWLSYQHRHRVGDAVTLFTSAGYEERLSSERLFGEWSKIYATGAGSYHVSSHLRLAAGIGTYYTFQPNTSDVFELRLWQGGTIFWPELLGSRRLVFTHRIRAEQRVTESNEWDFAARVRYRLEAKLPLNRFRLGPGSWYLPAAAELFFDVGAEIPEFFANRNRLSAGVGYVLDETWTLDLRYHRELTRATTVEDFESADHVVDLQLRTSVRIRDFVRSR